MSSAPLERARAGDPNAFIDLVRAHPPAPPDAPAPDPGEREALLRACLEAFRELPERADEGPVGPWLAGFAERAGAGGRRLPAGEDPFWERLATALAAEAPALAEPALPERRWPVVPRLQVPRRGQGRRRRSRNN